MERVTAAHKKQVQTYLRRTGCKLGYLLNFSGEVMKAGITRCVNGLQEWPSPPPRLCGRENPDPDQSIHPTPCLGG